MSLLLRGPKKLFEVLVKRIAFAGGLAFYMALELSSGLQIQRRSATL